MPIRKLFTCSKVEDHHIEWFITDDGPIAIAIYDIQNGMCLASVSLDEETYKEFIFDMQYEVNKHFG